MPSSIAARPTSPIALPSSTIRWSRSGGVIAEDAGGDSRPRSRRVLPPFAGCPMLNSHGGESRRSPRWDVTPMGWMERRASDLACLKGAWRTLKMTTPIARHPARVFPVVIDELADRYGDALALLSDRESFTYRELAARSNQYARWALAQGIQKGDTICLMMPNRPEYMAIWLGITRVGGVVALLNSNLAGRVLAYCVNAVKPKHVVVAA